MLFCVSLAIGALPQTLPPFLSWHKKGGKKGQDCARFARKMVVRKAQIVQLVEVRWSGCKCEKDWHELQLRTGTIFNRLPRLFFGSPAKVDHRITHKEYAMYRFLHAIWWTNYYWLQQLTMDNWQLTMKRQISRLLFLNAFSLYTFSLAFPDCLNAFSLNTFGLAISIAYCLCSSLFQFQIPLKPSALTTSVCAVPYCYWGVAPNPTSFFVLTQKRRQKRSRRRPFRSKNWRSEGSNRPTCWSSMIRLQMWKSVARTSTSNRDDF